MIDVVYFSANPTSPASGYWDMTLIGDILKHHAFTAMEAKGGAVVVMPGAYQVKYVAEVNRELKKYSWVILIIASDEESLFPVEKIDHKNIRIYVQTPKVGRHDKYRKFPLGYTGETRKYLKLEDKNIDVFYSAQKTHIRRMLCSQKLAEAVAGHKLQNCIINDTDGFTKGFPPDEYMNYMNRAKVAPAPSGAVSQESFRVYEALEAGVAPIADNISPNGNTGLWDYIFGSVPFATIGDYDNLPGYINDQLKRYPAHNNEIQAWWIKKKHDLAWQIIHDIEELSGIKHSEKLTAIIPVSPIKSHPSTEILEQTIASIRTNLPDCEIIITFDGVRKEQEQMRENYEEFIRRALFRCNTDWNAIPIIFKEHTHQVGMAKVALEEVKTDVILYAEQDTPLVTDEPIAWDHLIATITLCDANVIRLHFEGVIPDAHKHLMIGEPENDLLRTIQWSQRPHLASTAFYKYILRSYFSEHANCFIEDKIHGVVQRDYAEMGFRGWDIWKLFIYYPDPKNIKRSLNLDGRAGAKKYDERQVF